MSRRRAAIIIVHGIGKQARYDLTKEVSSKLYKQLKKMDASGNWEFIVDKVELNRKGVRTIETSDLFTHLGPIAASDAAARERLFRPISIHCDDHELNFYEAYWADEDLQYSRFGKLGYNLWILTTIWNPLFNLLTGKYKFHSLNCIQVLSRLAKVFVLGIVYHLAELLFFLLSFLFRNNRWGEMIYEYAGDVKLYSSTKEYFHNQTKQDVILARFHEVIIKAYLENDEIYVVSSSLGSVVAFDGLTASRVHPSKMATDFLHYLQEDYPSGRLLEPIDFKSKVKMLITVGSPLDKFYFFWPSRRHFSLQPPFRLKRHSMSSKERPRWETEDVERTEGEQPDIAWYNFDECADPIGAKIDYYGEVEGIRLPQNVKLARAWFPSTAHTGYWDHPGLMGWLAKTVRRLTAGAAEVPKDSSLQQILRLAGGLGLFALSVMTVGPILVFLLDFTLSLAHDLYMDAESNTIFNQLAWLDVIIRRLREMLGFQEGSWLTILGRTLRLLATLLLISLPFSAYFYRRNEQRIARHKAQR